MDFVLDVAKWRCGKDGDHALGEGATRLMNAEGYMCCLGQVSLQCMDIEEKDIFHKIDPESLFLVGEGFIDVGDSVLTRKLVKGEENWKGETYHRTNNDLSKEAMSINDDDDIDNLTRIEKLTAVFKRHGHKLKVINDHLLQQEKQDEN